MPTLASWHQSSEPEVYHNKNLSSDTKRTYVGKKIEDVKFMEAKCN